MTLDQIIAEYGLPALFAGAAIAGETVVVIGGIMVHRGILPFLPAIAAASAGSFVADQIFFLLGRRFRDHAFVQRVQRKAAFAKALSTFERHPTIFVFAFRFLYGLRTVSPIAIGTTRIPARTFLLINACAAILWGTVFVSAGYFFGSAIEAVFGKIRSVVHVVLPLVAVAVVIGVAGLLIRQRKSADRDSIGA
ncbi:DedA family protein [Novosphingobium sp. HR1a]|nr:DedA family protein [Novosphingobium sp. HR1a]